MNLLKLFFRIFLTSIIAKNANAQTTITFSVQQPLTPLVVDAGNDQQLVFGNSYVLGGSPTATGGYGNYTFQWDNAQFLDNPNIANPTVNGLFEAITFTLTVWDSVGLCVKQDQVFIDIVSGLADLQMESSLIRLYPNPFYSYLMIESKMSISNVRLINNIGKTILEKNFDSKPEVRIETQYLSDGVYFVAIKLTDASYKYMKLCKISTN
jgi:hypothetical protein